MRRVQPPMFPIQLKRVFLAFIWFALACVLPSLVARSGGGAGEIAGAICNPWAGVIIGGGVGTLLSRLLEGLVAGLFCGFLAAVLLVIAAYSTAGYYP